MSALTILEIKNAASGIIAKYPPIIIHSVIHPPKSARRSRTIVALKESNSPPRRAFDWWFPL
jgi:hypothetical protein